MKYLIWIPICMSVILFSCQKKEEGSTHEHGVETNSDASVDTLKKSVPKEEHAQINDTHFMIKYHAPAVRGRTIWGGLVPFNEVWVTGAHSATSLEINKEILINGTTIAPGKYALFTIPGEKKWTIIINKNWEQHLADDYDSKEDLVRIEAIPETLSNIQERLKYSIVDEGNSKVSISISWEKLKVTLPIQIQ